MTAVLCLARPPLPPVHPPELAPVVVDVGEPDPLMRLAAAVEAALRDNDAVVVIRPTWAAPQAGDLVGSVRALLETDAVIEVVTPLPPLATGVLAAQLCHVAQAVSTPALLVPGARLLEANLLAMAWTASVSRLDQPGVGLRAHLRSWLPGSAFLVATHPTAMVSVLGRGEPAPINVTRPAGPLLGVVCASESADPAVVDGPLLRFLGAARVVGCPPTPALARWWGTGRVVEVVAVPLDLEAAGPAVAARYPVRPCPWCRRPATVGPCPWCGSAAGPFTGSSGSAGAGASRPAAGSPRRGFPPRLTPVVPGHPLPDGSPSEQAEVA